MSVYTTVGRTELAAWLEPLALGALSDFAGIAAGMQNSNYFVTAGGVRRVLTVFEHLTPAQLDFYLALMAHLAAHGIPVRNRSLLPTAGSGARWPANRRPCSPVCRGRIWKTQWRKTVACWVRPWPVCILPPRILPTPCPIPVVPPGASGLAASWRPGYPQKSAVNLLNELEFQAAQDYSLLPRGVIHGDLFRDNVLWQAGQLTGVLDFYFAGEDALLFDLAVVANDWCIEAGSLPALVSGYRSVRPIGDLEARAWPALRRAAALRFWLLRLEVRHRPWVGEVVTIKDPDHFGHLLQQLCLAPAELPR